MVDGFGEHAVERPEPRQRTGFTGGAVDVAGEQRPFEGGPEVVDVAAEPFEPLQLLRATDGDLAALGQVGEVVRVAFPGVVGVEFGEHVERVGAERVEQAVAVRTGLRSPWTASRARPTAPAVRRARSPATARAASRSKVPANTPSAGEERALLVGEQLEAPVDRGRAASVAVRRRRRRRPRGGRIGRPAGRGWPRG